MNVNENVDFNNLSKEDELSVRKILVEQMLETCKTQFQDKAMKSKGLVIFLERWIKDIDKEIYS